MGGAQLLIKFFLEKSFGPIAFQSGKFPVDLLSSLCAEITNGLQSKKTTRRKFLPSWPGYLSLAGHYCTITHEKTLMSLLKYKLLKFQCTQAGSEKKKSDLR